MKQQQMKKLKKYVEINIVPLMEKTLKNDISCKKRSTY